MIRCVPKRVVGCATIGRVAASHLLKSGSSLHLLCGCSDLCCPSAGWCAAARKLARLQAMWELTCLACWLLCCNSYSDNACRCAMRRLAELQGVLELTDVLAALVEQYSSGAGGGGRGVLGLRPALQQLCKAALDGLHRRSLGKLTSESAVGVSSYIV